MAAARELGDQATDRAQPDGLRHARCLRPERPEPYFAEATELARAVGRPWSGLYQLRAYQTFAGALPANRSQHRLPARRDGTWPTHSATSFMSRYCRAFLSSALNVQGKLEEAADWRVYWLRRPGRPRIARWRRSVSMHSLAVRSRFRAMPTAHKPQRKQPLEIRPRLGGFHEDSAYAALASAALARGDAVAARRACDAAWHHTYPLKELLHQKHVPMAEATLGCGDLAAARRWADDSVAVVPGFHQVLALTARARVALAQGEPGPGRARRPRCARASPPAPRLSAGGRRSGMPCPVGGRRREPPHMLARILGAADGIRQRTGEARFPMYQQAYDTALEVVREGLGQGDFDAAWAEGARCRPRRRSPTRSAVVVNASAPRVAGAR